MATGPPAGDRAEAVGRSAYSVLRESFVTGVAVVVPAVISLYVLVLVWGAVAGALRPVVATLEVSLGARESRTIVQAGAALLLVAVTLAVGFLARFRSGERAIDYLDGALERVPGFGTIYASFRQMSDVLLESDSRNFRDVKLVEFPREGTYTLGFETTATPDPIEDAADEEGMRTLFLPLAPNPVMGGFLAHIPAGRVRDVDMTVDEGVSTVVTTGVATAEVSDDDGLAPEDMERLTGVDVAGTSGASEARQTNGNGNGDGPAGEHGHEHGSNGNGNGGAADGDHPAARDRGDGDGTGTGGGR